MRRHEISDDHWERIKDFFPGQTGDPGVTAKDNRLFVNAILWIARTGAPLRGLPERFRPWNSAWKRFDRWSQKGIWKRVFRDAPKSRSGMGDHRQQRVVRAHQHAAGAALAPRSTSWWTPWATRLSSFSRTSITISKAANESCWPLESISVEC